MKRAEDEIIFKYLAETLSGNGVFVDIGARKGFWYRNLWRSFPNTTAHLFEPTPNIVAYTRKNYKNKKNIHIHQYAISDYCGVANFNIDLKSGGWSGLRKQQKHDRYRVIEVDIATLDSFNINNVEFIKIDVEGNELFTLYGAIETIKKYRPTIYFECAYLHTKHYNYLPDAVFQFLSDNGYKIFDLDFKELTLDDFAARTNRLLPYDTSFYGNFIAKCP